MQSAISLRIDSELKKQLENIAKDDRRSLNNLISIALEEYVLRKNRRNDLSIHGIEIANISIPKK